MPLPATDGVRDRARAARTAPTRARGRRVECRVRRPPPRAAPTPFSRVAPMRTSWPAGPYFTALSSRLSSIWRTAPGSAGTIRILRNRRRPAWRRAPPRAAQSRRSLPGRAGRARSAPGVMCVVWRSEREKCSRFSTRCVSRRASWSMIASERRRSSSERTRPSVSVSENIRICASGVRSSCDTPEMKSLRSRASCDSRAQLDERRADEKRR